MNIRNRLLALALGTALGTMVASAAMADPTTSTSGDDPFMVRAGDTQVSTTCLTDHPGSHIWNVGAAPFASTEAQANAKLHDWLQIVIQQNQLTADDASRIEAWIKDHPQGDATTAILGAHVDFMASSEVGKPVVTNLCYDPTYDFETKDGFGKSTRALTALSWTIPGLSKGTLLFSRFFWCYNWGGEWITIPSPSPVVIAKRNLAKPDCVEIDYVLPPHTVGVAFDAFGAVTPATSSHCPSAHPSAHCQEDCVTAFGHEEDRIHERDGITLGWHHVAAYAVQDQDTVMSDSLIGTAEVTRGGYAISICIDVKDPVTGQIHHAKPKTLVWVGPTSRRRWEMVQSEWQFAD